MQYVVKRGDRLYFELGKKRAEPLKLDASVALGVDGPEAWTKAATLLQAYRKAKAGGPEEDRLGGYPAGSLGAFYTMWKRTDDWTEKGDRTQEDYERGWAHIGPEFGRTLLGKITVADSERFHRTMRKTLTPSEAWRVLKVWRALLNTLEKKHLVARAPIGSVSNTMPKGRGEFWLERDIQRMVRACGKLKHPTMALLIRLAWETAMSPVDCRTLSKSMLKRDRDGWYVERPRTKTGAEAKPTISDQLVADIHSYTEALEASGLEILDTAPLFRNPEARAYSKNYLVDQFQIIRRVTFGKHEKRQFLDIRRSVNLEAALGDASPEDRAAALANALDKNKALDAVYTPVTTARSRRVQKARETGRALLAQEVGRKAQ